MFNVSTRRSAKSQVSRGTRSKRKQVSLVLARILAKTEIDPTTGCWIWKGYTNGSRVKYGRTYFFGPGVYAHRALYELTYGAIPEGIHIDHVCRQPLCCCPWHLEGVTQAINNARQRSVNRDKRVCKRGHPLVVKGVDYYYMRASQGKPGMRRQCKKCAKRKNHLALSQEKTVM